MCMWDVMFLLRGRRLDVICHRGGPVSIPGQSLWDSWWIEWHCSRIFSECFLFLMSVSLRQCAILILICMLLLTRRTNGRTLGTLLIKQRPFVNLRAFDMNVLLFIRYTVNLNCSLNFDVKCLANFCVYLPVFKFIYEGNSVSKLQIQVATYVFELSAGNCHR
jgi:hypothetical protein